MVDKVDGSQANVAAQVAEQQRLEELEQAQRERLLADAAIEKALEVSQAEQVQGDAQPEMAAHEASGDTAAGFSGTEVSDLASDQQDRGESWDEFSSREDDSRTRAAHELQVGQSDTNEASSGEKINVGDLMKDMALQSGRIKS